MEVMESKGPLELQGTRVRMVDQGYQERQDSQSRFATSTVSVSLA